MFHNSGTKLNIKQKLQKVKRSPIMVKTGQIIKTAKLEEYLEGRLKSRFFNTLTPQIRTKTII